MTTTVTTLFWCIRCETFTEGKRETKQCRKCKGKTEAVGFVETCPSK